SDVRTINVSVGIVTGEPTGSANEVLVLLDGKVVDVLPARLDLFNLEYREPKKVLAGRGRAQGVVARPNQRVSLQRFGQRMTLPDRRGGPQLIPASDGDNEVWMLRLESRIERNAWLHPGGTAQDPKLTQEVKQTAFQLRGTCRQGPTAFSNRSVAEEISFEEPHLKILR